MGTTLREALENSVVEVEETAGQEVPAGEVSDTTPPVASTAGTPAQADAQEKAGRTAGRARNEKGQLLPGKAQKDSAAQPEAALQLKVAEAQAPASSAAEPPKPALTPVPRPSTFKKEMWGLWDKLNKGEALTAQEARQWLEYGLERENQFTRGVSTYKSEFDNAKPLVEAMAPFQGYLKQVNLKPEAVIGDLMRAHQTLVYGTPQDKLMLLARIAQQNQIPVENLFVQGQDGRIHFNPQLTQRIQAQQPQTQSQQPVDVRKEVQDVLLQERAEQSLAQMRADTTKYPHFETVRESMLGLLQAGLAQDLESAYEASLRLPQHSAIFEQMQAAQRAAEEKAKADERARAVTRARSNAVSVKSASATGASSAQGKKGLRGAIEDAAETHFSTGRV